MPGNEPAPVTEANLAKMNGEIYIEESKEKGNSSPPVSAKTSMSLSLNELWTPCHQWSCGPSSLSTTSPSGFQRKIEKHRSLLQQQPSTSEGLCKSRVHCLCSKMLWNPPSCGMIGHGRHYGWAFGPSYHYTRVFFSVFRLPSLSLLCAIHFSYAFP